MRYSLTVKFIIFFLTACALVAAIGGGVGIVAMESAGLYVGGLEILQERESEHISEAIASEFVHYHAVKQLSNLNYTMRESRYPNPKDRGDADHWTVQLMQGSTVLLEATAQENYTQKTTYALTPQYPILSTLSPDQVEALRSSERLLPPEGYLYCDTELALSMDGIVTYYFYYYEAPEYTVTVYMNPEVLESSAIHILTAMYPYRYGFILLVVLGLLGFAAGLVYLCWAAGRTTDRKVRPGGLNRMALDVYALTVLAGGSGLLALYRMLLRWMRYEGPHPGNLSLIAINILVAAQLVLGLLCAFSAQVKCPGYLWRNSALGRLCRWLRRVFQWLSALARLLPLTWRWLAGFSLLFALLAAGAVLAVRGTVLPLILTGLAGIGWLCYFCYAYGCVLRGAKRMADGDFSTKIPTKYLYGSCAAFARDLNTVSQAAVETAKKQMRADRMKAELITNISHDIKTPLTSIVSYVDLLEKPHDPAQQQQYLEVLGRQSQRLKKLLEDLVEMSRASSGSISVELTRLDAAEAVNQALGEFSDKLAQAGLSVVFQPPNESLFLLADGRLLWRVLSNLLSNVVKYAQPGTRVYVDLMQTDAQVCILLKNTSREMLNISAQELTERFVRGDTARNTEGSGLGLHIAQSLMELQGGQLQLSIDGDLFRAQVQLPQAEDCAERS